jgi:hypothetical protein
LRQVIVHLHPQPRVGGATEGLLKTYSHFRRNASSTRDDTVKLLARDAKGFGGFHNGQPQLVNIRLDQVARMGRIFHRHWCSPSSVIIDKINIESFAVRETENDSPICPHRDGPKSLKPTLEGMKPKARTTQPFIGLGGIKRGQNFPDAFHQLRRQVLAIVVLVKSSQPFVSKTFNHRPSVLYRAM